MNFTEKLAVKQERELENKELGKKKRMSQDDGEGSRRDICKKNNV